MRATRRKGAAPDRRAARLPASYADVTVRGVGCAPTRRAVAQRSEQAAAHPPPPELHARIAPPELSPASAADRRQSATAGAVLRSPVPPLDEGPELLERRLHRLSSWPGGCSPRALRLAGPVPDRAALADRVLGRRRLLGLGGRLSDGDGLPSRRTRPRCCARRWARPAAGTRAGGWSGPGSAPARSPCRVDRTAPPSTEPISSVRPTTTAATMPPRRSTRRRSSHSSARGPSLRQASPRGARRPSRRGRPR